MNKVLDQTADKILTQAMQTISNDKRRSYSMRLFTSLVSPDKKGLEDFLLATASREPQYIADLQHVAYNLYPEHKPLLDKILLLL